MSSGRLWWVKRGTGEAKGPFPAAVIEKNIAQGRILPTDQISVDRDRWQPATSYPDFDVIAASLASNASLKRGAPADGKRRLQREPVAAGQASADPALDARAERSAEVWARLRPARPRQRLLPYLLLTMLVIGLFILAISRTMPSSNETRCSAPAGPAVNFEFCNLEGRSFRGMNLAGAVLRSAHLAGADFGGADLRDADLAYADLRGSLLSEARLDRARLVGAVLKDAVLEGANLQGADLGFADLSGARIKRSVFADARIEQTVLPSGRVCAGPTFSSCESLPARP